MFCLLDIERLLSLWFLTASETLCFKGVDGRHAVEQGSSISFHRGPNSVNKPSRGPLTYIYMKSLFTKTDNSEIN